MKCSCLSHNGFLTERGFAELAQRESDRHVALAVETPQLYLDSPSSVSGLRRDEDLCDYMIDEQYRRFLNGS